MGGYYGIDNIYVSFSGGKDSTVLLDLARRVFPDVLAVFVNTGLEYPEVRKFVKTVDNVQWLCPEMNFKEVIIKYGYPIFSKEISKNIQYGRKALKENNQKNIDRYINGKRINPKTGEVYKFMNMTDIQKKVLYSDIPCSNQCCTIMKKKPAKKFEKETGRHPIIGTMATESLQRKNHWLEKGCNAFEGYRPISNPLSFWTEQDILEYLHRFNIPYASVYGDIVKDDEGKWTTTGEKRTGCFACAFGVHLESAPNKFQRDKINHPKLWETEMKPLEEGGLGMKEVLDFIGVPIE